MVKNINAQKKWAPGWKNYPKESLLKAFRNYKAEVAFGQYKTGQREQLWSKWRNLIETRRSEDWFDEFEFDPTDEDWIREREVPGTKKEVRARQDDRPAAPDTERLINAVGKDNAQMEIKAWGVIYDAWDGFPRKLQDAIRQAEQKGISFTEIMMFDEVSEILNELVK